MPFFTKRQPLILSAEEKQKLESLRRSRSREKREVVHAAILLDSAGGKSDGAVARSNGVNRHTVALCCAQIPSVRIGGGAGRTSATGEKPPHSGRCDHLGAASSGMRR